MRFSQNVVRLGLKSRKHFQIKQAYYQIAVSGFLIMSGIGVNAQVVSDTVKTVHINPQILNSIHFHGYIQPGSNGLRVLDSLRFNPFSAVKMVTRKEFQHAAFVYAEKYLKLMEEIYKPLREEQQRIIENANAEGPIKRNDALGYQDALKMPTEMMNQNKHVETPHDYVREHEAEEIMKKYEQPKK
jgi:hypothetical protein